VRPAMLGGAKKGGKLLGPEGIEDAAKGRSSYMLGNLSEVPNKDDTIKQPSGRCKSRRRSGRNKINGFSRSHSGGGKHVGSLQLRGGKRGTSQSFSVRHPGKE